MKYADDTYLLVGSSNIQTVAEELRHIEKWANYNNLRRSSTTREMLVKRKCFKGPLIPTVIPGAERVDTMRVLGVTLRSNVKVEYHLDEVLATCASSLYALRILQSHSFPPTALHDVARATTIAHLMYASSAWWGYTGSTYRDRIEGLIRRMKRGGFLTPNSCNAILMLTLQMTIFSKHYGRIQTMYSDACCLLPDKIVNDLTY